MDEYVGPVFPSGITVPMRLTSMREVFHPSAGKGHSHWFYEFEPDRDQAALMEMNPDCEPDPDPDLEALMDESPPQKVVISPMRVGTTRPTADLCVGDLFDVVLVPRAPLPLPEMSDSGIRRLLTTLFGNGEPDDDPDARVVAIVPLLDLEAAEYDLPPDIEGLPDLTHIDGGQWMNMTTVERLQAINQARQEQR